MQREKDLLAFGEFEVDPSQRLLFLKHQQIPLSPKAFDTLLALVEAGGRIVEKEELLRKVWPDTFVEEGSLARNISVLRKALGESPDDQKYIQTIPRRGYRFVAPVTVVAPAGAMEDEIEQSVLSVRGIQKDEQEGALRKSWRGLPFTAASALKVAAILVLLVLAAMGFAWRKTPSPERTRTRGEVTPLIRSLAVLPLQSLSADPQQDYFADGITDALITSLAQIRALKVISRASVMRYKQTAKSAPEIAHELGVDAIISGSVQREGNRARISAQLIEASTDRHLWAKSYDRDLSSILSLEGELAIAIATEVEVRVEADTRNRLKSRPPVRSSAQDQYLLARHQQDIRDEPHLQQAIQHYEAAIQLEPNFAGAFAGMAQAWVQRGVLGAAGFRASEGPARRAAIRALELDPHLAEAHEALAHVLLFYDMAWVTAEQEFRRAIDLNPNYVDAHIYYATLLEILGRFPEAIAEGQRSLELDPVSVTVTSEYGRVLFRARKYDDAIRQFQRTLELDPRDGLARVRLADALMQEGRFPEALNVFPTTRAQEARAYALLGRKDEARKILAGPGAPTRPGLDLALVYFALGDRDRGFDLLREVFDERRYASLIVCDPRWDPVRDDPRFRALVHRLGLPNTAASSLHGE